jgi:hypothetical protein
MGKSIEIYSRRNAKNLTNRQQYDDATFMAVLNHNLDFKL